MRKIVNNRIREVGAEYKKKISSSKDIADIMRAIYAANCTDIECFYVVGLNSNNVISFIELHTAGTVNQATPIIREVLRSLLIAGAASCIVAHNHPSGVITPSNEDRKFTTDLRQACKLLGINFLDHIIIGEGYYSFSDNGN